MDMRLTICGTGNGGADFDVETPTFKDFHYRDKVRHISWGRMQRRRTDMTSASEGNSSRESTNTATDNGDLELLETRGQRGRRERGIHERVRIVALKGREIMGEVVTFLY